jgi:hypothetical protein
MQPKLGESPGQLGGGYEIFIVEDTIAIRSPVVQTAFGPHSAQLKIPREGVIACTRDSNYAFIVYARRESSPTAYAYRFDLNAGTHAKYDLPNDREQILAHIHSFSPSVKHIDPVMLTGDAEITQAIDHAFVAIGIGLSISLAIALVLLLRFRKRRSAHPHPTANSF